MQSLGRVAIHIEQEQDTIMLIVSFLLHGFVAKLHKILLQKGWRLLLPISRKEDSITSGSQFLC